jgi:hypothetical protein
VESSDDAVERRAFIVGTFALLAAPLVVRAQQRGRSIGLASYTSASTMCLHIWTDCVGLRALGYDVDTLPAPRQSTVFEGRNLRLDWRNLTDVDAARVAAQEVVRDRVDLIVALEDQTIRPAMGRPPTFPSSSRHRPTLSVTASCGVCLVPGEM